MPTVKFTSALKRFYPALETTELSATSLTEALEMIDMKYQGLRAYILDEQGQLRKHVNIFVDGTLINDRKTLSDVIKIDSEIFIMQALSGG